jgi:hypothetical protein
MKLNKVLYVYALFTVAIIAVIVYNIKLGNTYPALNLLSFNLEALTNESDTGGESDAARPPKCVQRKTVSSDPLNVHSCASGSLYSNHAITNHKYYCDEGANTAAGCKSITIKYGHDCNNQYCQTPEEVLQAFENASCTYRCPKQ